MKSTAQEQIKFLSFLRQRNVNYTIRPGKIVDVNGNVDISDMHLTKIPVQFGVVNGSFNCHHNQLTSLQGAPEEVGSDFYCHHNQLTTLQGAPKKVKGSFDCSHNQLTSLEGSPEEVGGWFDCSYNQLTSLEGAPEKVEECFNCSYNQLTSLIGCPEEVGGGFYCNYNPVKFTEEDIKLAQQGGQDQKFLMSLMATHKIDNYTIRPDGLVDVDGSVILDMQLTKIPVKFGIVTGYFDCSYNDFTSLIGCPERVEGSFYCDHNQLTSLEGCPRKVGGTFECSHNRLTSLKGCPEKVGNIFYCDHNPVHFTKEDIKLAKLERSKTKDIHFLADQLNNAFEDIYNRNRVGIEITLDGPIDEVLMSMYEREVTNIHQEIFDIVGKEIGKKLASKLEALIELAYEKGLKDEADVIERNER